MYVCMYVGMYETMYACMCVCAIAFCDMVNLSIRKVAKSEGTGRVTRILSVASNILIFRFFYIFDRNKNCSNCSDYTQ